MTTLGDCDEALLSALRAQRLDTVEGAFAYGGGEDLVKPGLGVRRRTRLRIVDAGGTAHDLYLKRYGPETFGRRVRRRWTYGRWCTPGGVEFANIRSVGAAGVPTMRAVLFGQEPVGPLRGARSHLIVTAVGGDALERCFEDFLARHRHDGCTAELSDRLGELIRAFHEAGYCHRDLYTSHVFLDDRAEEFDLYLIDLARAFRPRWRKLRWRAKDLAQLKYSMPPEWVAGFWGAFLAAYLGGPTAPSGGDKADVRRYNRAIDRKAAAMRRRGERKSRRQAQREPT